MADLTFNTVAGQDIKRELMIAYLNTGTASNPVWAPIGRKVSDSNLAMDWSKDTQVDILGDTYTSLKRGPKTQDFDPIKLDAGDAIAVKLWNMAIKDEDIGALAAQDMLIVHYYAGTASAPFAIRYSACAIELTSIGGEGGGVLEIATSITYGGTRTTGTVSKDATTGAITFTPDNQ